MPHSLPRATPESQGVPTGALRELIRAFDGIDAVHGLVVVRRGHVIAEANWAPYRPNEPQHVYSVSKSFTSTAVGFAIAEGLVSLDDRVVDLFPESAPPVVDERLAALRVRHLLAMSTGHAGDTMDAVFDAGDGDGIAAFLALPLAYEPGTYFFYNTGASFVLSAIVQKASGLRLLDYLTPRLLEPLGIVGATWHQSLAGIDDGGFGLSVRPIDIAALGQLYLQRGRWGDRQLLSEEWVDAATSLQSDNSTFGSTADWQSGYGFHFWLSTHGYRGDGAFGQYCLVLPEEDVVVAITGSLADMQVPLYPVWEGLLPALSANPLVEDPDVVAGLAQDVARLTVKSPGGAAITETARRVGSRFALEKNSRELEAVSLRPQVGGSRLELRIAGVDYELEVGYGEWLRAPFAPWPDEGAEFAARGGWTGEREFQARLASTSTPFAFDLSLVFSDDETVELTAQEHVSFGPIVPLRVHGRAI